MAIYSLFQWFIRKGFCKRGFWLSDFLIFWLSDFLNFRVLGFWLSDFSGFGFLTFWLCGFCVFDFLTFLVFGFWLSDFSGLGFLTFWLFGFWVFDFLTFLVLGFWLSDFSGFGFLTFRLFGFWVFDFQIFWLFDFLTFWLSDFLTFWLSDFLTFWLLDFGIWSLALKIGVNDDFPLRCSKRKHNPFRETLMNIVGIIAWGNWSYDHNLPRIRQIRNSTVKSQCLFGNRWWMWDLPFAWVMKLISLYTAGQWSAICPDGIGFLTNCLYKWCDPPTRNMKKITIPCVNRWWIMCQWGVQYVEERMKMISL